MSTTLKLALGFGGLFAVLIFGVWALPAEHDRGDLTGSWRVTVRLEDSGRSTIRFVLRQDDDLLTGHYDGSYGTQPITGTVADGRVELFFKIRDETQVAFLGTLGERATWKAPATTARWPDRGPGAPNEQPAPGASRIPGEAPAWRRCFLGHSPPGCSLVAPCQTNAASLDGVAPEPHATATRGPRVPHSTAAERALSRARRFASSITCQDAEWRSRGPWKRPRGSRRRPFGRRPRADLAAGHGGHLGWRESGKPLISHRQVIHGGRHRN